jgi:ketol-acid reductoisomerase
LIDHHAQYNKMEDIDMTASTLPNLRIFTKKDADPHALEGEKIGILGYGNLGRPFALNLRDSGVESVVIGNIQDAYADQAISEGFKVVSLAEASKMDIVLILLPDEVIPEVFSREIAPNLSPHSAIVFASGYTKAYDLIQPPRDVDILLLAPRMAGENARQRYINHQGFYAYISVEQDTSGKAWKRLLGLSSGVGVLDAAALEISLCMEADLDLFIEQTLGAIVGLAIMNAYSVGQAASIPVEALAMEMYIDEEMETVWRGFREKGFFRSSLAHGPTAMYGGYLRTMELMQLNLDTCFTKILEEIHNGKFAHQFQEERQSGYPMLEVANQMIATEDMISKAEDWLKGQISSANQDPQ